MDAAHLKPLADRLVAQQHADGGWSQLARLDSDAYATGEVLVALREGHIPAADPAWQRGLSYLKRTQKPDGSWLVRSRLHEQRLVSPPYFESGFPYGANQMISCMGTSWATAALLFATDAPRPTEGREQIDVAAVTAPGAPWMEPSVPDGELKRCSMEADRTDKRRNDLLMMAAGDSGVRLPSAAQTSTRATAGSPVDSRSQRLRDTPAGASGAAAAACRTATLFNASPAFFNVSLARRA
jgi:hypothetical protein